jgi:hypothetical protein
MQLFVDKRRYGDAVPWGLLTACSRKSSRSILSLSDLGQSQKPGQIHGLGISTSEGIYGCRSEGLLNSAER